MATAPAHDQRRLLDLQALDTRLDQIAHQRAKHPTLARLAELDSQLADLTTTLVASRTAASDLRRELNNIKKTARERSKAVSIRIRQLKDCKAHLDAAKGKEMTVSNSGAGSIWELAGISIAKETGARSNSTALGSWKTGASRPTSSAWARRCGSPPTRARRS